jgi:hypothetical protein
MRMIIMLHARDEKSNRRSGRGVAAQGSNVTIC